MAGHQNLVEQFEPTRYRLPNAIFINEKGVFRDGSREAGPDFQAPRAHRGLAHLRDAGG